MSWLYSRAKTGKVRVWRTWTESNIVHTQYGEKDGSMSTSSYAAVAVNVGKANERSALQQARFEADAMRKKKLETGWAETEDGIDNVILLPMLAKPYDGKAKGLRLVQPKLDGLRCFTRRVSDNEFRFTSRNGKEFKCFEHLIPHLRQMMEIGEILDGELYCHGVPLQKLSSLTRNKKPLSDEERGILQYHVYDIADADRPTRDRQDALIARFSAMYSLDDDREPPVQQVRTMEADSHDDIIEAHNIFVAEGYEGVMIRHPEALYEFNFRSSGLMKYKEFEDAEFEVVGFKEGVGKMEGAIIFRCKAKGGEFDVVMRGSLESRREMWQRRDELLGKPLTVRYQNYSPDGIPIFPVGIAIRDYE